MTRAIHLFQKLVKSGEMDADCGSLTMITRGNGFVVASFSVDPCSLQQSFSFPKIVIKSLYRFSSMERHSIDFMHTLTSSEMVLNRIPSFRKLMDDLFLAVKRR